MIYCVDDDEEIRKLIVYTLKASGFEAEGFEDGESFFAAINCACGTHFESASASRAASPNSADNAVLPELILLDIMLPSEDGISILKKLKASQKTAGIPVIMATAKGAEYDKVQGLDEGADDYLVKPFGMMEMVSRIRAVLRRCGNDKAPTEFTFGPITLDEAKHVVSISGERAELTLKEYEILRLLIKSPGRVFSREALLSGVWGTDFLGESRTVDVHVATLRTKLKDAGRLIVTVRGVGYKLENFQEAEYEQKNL